MADPKIKRAGAITTFEEIKEWMHSVVLSVSIFLYTSFLWVFLVKSYSVALVLVVHLLRNFVLLEGKSEIIG